MRIFVHTLGCRVNQYESQLLRERLAGLPEKGELFVVNTCTVTALADRKGRKLIRHLRREHPGALIVAVGCGAGEGLRDAGANLVVGNKEKARLREVVEAFLHGGEGSDGAWPPLDAERVSSAPRTRALLKVQDGCTRGCSFCRTWQVRGPLRSKTPGAAREEAATLARAGHREIVLVGTNLAQYGMDLPDRPSLVDLLRGLLAVPGVRYRLSSLNPDGLTPELVELFAQEGRLCPYLQLPLQSGDEGVLRRMGRPYTAAEYEERARAFLSRVPKAAVGADVMVGFPGEGEAAFRRTVGLLGRLLPLRVHVFPFSPRPGTPAAGMAGQVSPEVKARRAAELRALALGWSQQAYRRFWGQPMRVLLEERKGGLWWGHAENYARVGVPQSGAVRGKIVTARLFRVEEGCALGVITNSSEDLRYTA